MNDTYKFQLRFLGVFVAITVVATTLTNRGMHVATATFASLAIAALVALAIYVGVRLADRDNIE